MGTAATKTAMAMAMKTKRKWFVTFSSVRYLSAKWIRLTRALYFFDQFEAKSQYITVLECVTSQLCLLPQLKKKQFFTEEKENHK